MIRGLFRFLFNMLRMFVRLLDLVVRGAFYALMIFGIGALVAFFLRPEPAVREGSALVLRPVGMIVEQAASGRPARRQRA
ncbi:MAG TPA: signal peptide peptidase SppA, partial [Thauera sp.]|nr:signal peptide peptidase SppA [Thauera sp.]